TQDVDVRNFQQEIRQCLANTLEGDELYSENKFLQVKGLIERFNGREGLTELDSRWTLKVTDVRNWFNFSASERWREDDTEKEFYSDSAGKSGGQKEKLAYTILAAALAYQFGLEWGAKKSRSFRFVVIDEAFGKGSDESTRYGLELFKKLNLQLLIVTPLQKIHVIEDYIRAVHFIHNDGGKNSILRNLSIEEYRKEKARRNNHRSRQLITPNEIQKKALVYWNSRRFLKAALTGESLFPLTIPFRKISAAKALEDFGAVRQWIENLQEKSRERMGYGYTLTFARVNHRKLGAQSFPEKILFEMPSDYLRFIGKEADFQAFCYLTETITQRHPSLGPWLSVKCGRVLEFRDQWPGLLSVVDFFLANPRPDRYLRELEIPGVDTKFVEKNKGILRELLDELLPDEAVDSSVTTLSGQGFQRRYGLRYDEQLIRFRLLDPSLCSGFGATDISVPVSEFKRLQIPCRTVFITENKTNGLSFPQASASIVIFGLGNGVQSLQSASWLKEKEIFYWGDIDTCGFHILSLLRGAFPRMESMLMDRETLFASRDLWVKEQAEERYIAELPHLTEAECMLYRELRDNLIGENIRLEQERIPYSRLKAAISNLSS
ncbi:MAG: hypothetical protein JRC86_09250, partial [Deltaproteobacteria bacterium]|nr:hypothetical protein [Deltaproteobacteria bacterium]